MNINAVLLLFFILEATTFLSTYCVPGLCLLQGIRLTAYLTLYTGSFLPFQSGRERGEKQKKNLYIFRQWYALCREQKGDWVRVTEEGSPSDHVSEEAALWLRSCGRWKTLFSRLCVPLTSAWRWSLHKQESTDLPMGLAPNQNAEGSVDEVDPTPSPLPGHVTGRNLGGFPACMWPIHPPGGSVQ